MDNIFNKPILEKTISEFKKSFKKDPSFCFVSPGRLEIIGNHTDHNKGLAIVAGASLAIYSAVSRNDINKIRLYSEGHDYLEIDVKTYEINDKEFYTSDALIKGVLTDLVKRGYCINGFDAYLISDVREGSGVSSSAAYELLIIEILNSLYNDDKISKLDKALIAQYAENQFFHKPCGVLDQIGSSFGKINIIDFNDEPISVKTISFPFDELHIYLINTGGDHSGLTSYYAEVTSDFAYLAKTIANKKYLREIDYQDALAFVNNNPNLFVERQIKRMKHFYEENERVKKCFKAISDNDLSSFLECINESGKSSSQYLCNTMVPGDYEESPEKSLTIARNVAPKSAHRVHGGGFKGTTLHFIIEEEKEKFVKEMSKIYGESNVIEVFINPNGATKI